MYQKRRTLKVTAILLLVLMFSTLALAGCSSGTDKTSSAEGNAQEPNGSADEETYVMRLAHGYPDTTNHGRNALYFKEAVEKYTNGRVEVKLYSNAQLGPINRELSMCLAGDIDATYNIGGIVETVDPAEAIYQIPFLVTSEPGVGDYAYAMKDNENIEGVLRSRQAELGFYRLGNLPSLFGFFTVANNVRPVDKLADAAGLKIRSSGGMMGNLFIESMKASPITIAGAEVPVALSQGVVDGMISHIAHYHDSKWHTKYITFPYWCGYSNPILVNLEWWEKLPADLQEIIAEKAFPETQEYAWEAMKTHDIECLEAIQKEPYNVKVSYLDTNDPAVIKWMEDVQKKGIEEFIKVVGSDAQGLIDETIKVGENLK